MTDPLAAWRLREAPFYQPAGDELALAREAVGQRLPLLLKGPTGCGKTRFVEFLAWELRRPLVTIACNEDTTAADLVGRYLLDAEGTRWHDGPLTLAARHGALCYLDEVVEARQDTAVVIHPLTDSRRLLPLDRRGEVVRAHPDFQLVVSYNPGYQSRAKDMKPSTRQRFAALAFGYPQPEAEAAIVARESGVEPALAARLVAIAGRTRTLRELGLEEGASTRVLVYAGALMREGVAPRAACEMTLVQPLTDEPALLQALREVVDAHFA